MTPAVTPSLVLTVWPPYFDEIRSGRKSVEGRPFTSRYEFAMGHFIHIVDKERVTVLLSKSCSANEIQHFCGDARN